LKMADNTFSKSKNATSSKNGEAVSRPSRMGTKKPKSSNKQQWWAFGVAAILTLMLCLTINFRAFSELSQETEQNSALEAKIQDLTTENLVIQEEIHYLKHDPGTVEREARKYGLRRSNQKVPVPANK
jgi:cell division protein FtsB